MAAAAEAVEHLLALRDPVNEKLEALRAEKRIGKSVEAALTLTVDPQSPIAALLQKHHAQLAECFIVSTVSLQHEAGRDSVAIEVDVAPGQRCPRCWRTVENLIASQLGEVCPRCADALEPFQVNL
jgi:isoleucyl-tRNA synthetase